MENRKTLQRRMKMQSSPVKMWIDSQEQPRVLYEYWFFLNCTFVSRCSSEPWIPVLDLCRGDRFCKIFFFTLLLNIKMCSSVENIHLKEANTLFLVVSAALLLRDKLAPHVTIHTIEQHYRHMSTWPRELGMRVQGKVHEKHTCMLHHVTLEPCTVLS